MNRIFLLLFFFVAATMSLFSSGIVESQDGLAYLSVARNIYYEHQAIAPPYEFDVGKNIHMNVSKGADGNYYSPTGLGFSLALVPAVAISDFLHKSFNVTPPVHFPLESDWSVLLIASFANPMFTGLLAVYICAFSFRLGASKKMSVAIALLTIFATNLFPLGKHGFAHMMFISNLMGTFFFIRRYKDEGKRKNLVFAAISFGIMLIAYGPVYFLTFPAILTYYFLLFRPRPNLKWIKQRLGDLFLGLTMLAPLLILYFRTNAQKSGSIIDSGYGVPTPQVFRINMHILFEGAYGLLLSPGRGFFWYSPFCLLLLVFWNKLQIKKYLAEFVALLLLATFFIYFHSMQNAGMDWLSWNGESSWGPRYIAVLVPFIGILIGTILNNLSLKLKIFVVAPIVLAGFGVQLLGVLLPYQIKFRGLQPELRLNDTRFTTADYGNFIPRYSPLVNSPRILASRFKSLKSQLSHGEFDVKFFDGVDFPFHIAGTQWRGLRSKAFISIKGTPQSPINSLNIGLANVPLSTATASAQVKLIISEHPTKAITLESGAWDNLETSVNNVDRELILSLETSSAAEKPKTQAVFIKDMSVNGVPISLRSLDFPYVQPLAAAMTNSEYRYFGKIETDPWEYWYLRSQIYEETLDLWWLKSFYYWDLPKVPLALLFFVIGETALISGVFLIEGLKKASKN